MKSKRGRKTVKESEENLRDIAVDEDMAVSSQEEETESGTMFVQPQWEMDLSSDEHGENKGADPYPESSKDVEGANIEPQEDDEGADVSSEDEPPEDVLWVKGKDQALQQKRLEAAAVKSAKLSVKEKRRLKAELFKKQKEAKLLKVPLKFPERNLDKVLERLAEKKASQEEEKEEVEDAPSERLQSRKKKAHQGVTKVGRAKVVVASHDEDSHAGSKYDYERGCNFLKEELYGSRLKRVPVLSQLHRSSKKRLGHPALNFFSNFK